MLIRELSSHKRFIFLLSAFLINYYMEISFDRNFLLLISVFQLILKCKLGGNNFTPE